MQKREYHTIDKSSWQRGQWDNEPDKVQWQDEETGLPCLAVRHPISGHWCGYVGVDERHRWHGVGYSGCLSPSTEHEHDWDCCSTPESLTQVHGGLTFAEACKPNADEASDVCHLPEPGEPDHVWWFGFDCAHGYDLSPAFGDYIVRGNSEYRTLSYVQAECAKLASQIREYSDV